MPEGGSNCFGFGLDRTAHFKQVPPEIQKDVENKPLIG
jgi:hypothetical protein